MKIICNLAHIIGRIAKIAAQFSHGLVNSAMGQIPCFTERMSCFVMTSIIQVRSELVMTCCCLAVEGVTYTSQCTSCEPGTFSSAAAAVCQPCPSNTFSHRRADTCTPCDDTQYSGLHLLLSLCSSVCLSRNNCI